MTSTIFKCLLLTGLLGAVWAGTGCTGGGDEDSAGDTSDTDSGPDTSVCDAYCSNVMSCSMGWGGGGQQYVSETMCVQECVGFIEGGGGCGDAASQYATCAGGITDCEDYGTLHDTQCGDLEDSYAGWCL